MEARSRRGAGLQAPTVVSNWIVFAGASTSNLGSLHVLWGTGGDPHRTKVVVVGGHGAAIFDLTAWGWVELIVGLLWASPVPACSMGNEIAGSSWCLPRPQRHSQYCCFTVTLWSIMIIAIDVESSTSCSWAATAG